jgi:hypothetical protein
MRQTAALAFIGKLLVLLAAAWWVDVFHDGGKSDRRRDKKSLTSFF